MRHPESLPLALVAGSKKEKPSLAVRRPIVAGDRAERLKKMTIDIYITFKVSLSYNIISLRFFEGFIFPSRKVLSEKTIF